MTHEPVVRALDVGHANVKYSTTDAHGNPCFKSFPSLAPAAVTRDLSAGAVKRRDTVMVTIEGNAFEVGPDARFAADAQYAHVFDDTYVERAEYWALTLGALTYLNAPVIDLLVVGLPVSRLEAYTDRLKATLEGQHTSSAGTCVTIKNVAVAAQPLGGALYAALTADQCSRFREETTFTVDVGGGTTDGLVSCGLNVFPARCWSHNGGTHAILRTIADALATRHGIDCSVGELHRALRTGVIKLPGRTLPLASYLKHGRPAVDQALNALMAHVGTRRDIDRILVVGGGARLFDAALRTRFPERPIEVHPEAVFANVKGFQFAGERIVEVWAESS